VVINDGLYKSLVGINNYNKPLENFQPIDTNYCIWLQMPLGYDEHIGMPPMLSKTITQ
jgi:hypothetical protein